jgi:Fic family protein
MRDRDADPWQYTDEENGRLGTNLQTLEHAVAIGQFTPLVSIEVLCRWHGRLFDGVREIGGRLRKPGFGPEFLSFGNRRSVSFDRVASEMDQLERRIVSECRALDSALQTEGPGIEERAMTAAITLQVELVRIHPFVDGNGRTARLLTNWLLVRYGLRPVPLERPRGEYIACMSRALDGDLDALLTFYWSNYPLG